ncbi:hypothetical protein SanaruYs_21170 [Chryseotalea sanaruensis]|uniref:DUF4340 domain-containing protein n=1 Tax=Chryseotalea sanaruensis TaxID=2482724 RepID=A0A401UAE6_9BACT|nr:DUF4340 domain-containing protein [Chryseotalea sanaruensis]GCC51888.1 hypothetical protein SanaruYs_21170 [Chryseotalea sanaruensis]
MQEKRNKLLFAVLLVSVAITTVIYFLGNETSSEVKNKDLFQVTESKVINRVELASASGKVTLSFNGTRWMVNETEAADRDMIDVLFATALQAEVKRPVAENRNDSVAVEVKATGVNVKFFEGDVLRKNFTAGGNNKKTEAYFIDETGKAYLMNIPGYRVYVSGVFELTEKQWWDKYVFPFNWSNVRDLAVMYPNKVDNNFTISLQEENFAIDNLPTDTTKLNDFLFAVSLLTVDEFIEIDSLKDVEPVLTVQVSDIANRIYTLSILPYVQAGKTACLVKQNHLAWIDNRKLARLVKNREFFRKKA